MKDLNSILQEAKSKLKLNGIDEREARLLLSHALNVEPSLILKFSQIDDEKEKIFMSLVEKRCSHVPYAYITGHKEFMKLDFIVNENVLIPRDDTEVLVENAIKICERDYSNNKTISILDICTGSGCIAISLAKYVEASKVTAIDISNNALELAKKNAKNNGVVIDFIQSNLFENLNKEMKFDVIVSNPPYIKTKDIESLQKEVVNNEPKIALDGGEDGLDFYRRISKDAKNYFNNKGYLIFEIGFDEKESVIKILEDEGYKNICTYNDYSGNNRVISGIYIIGG